MSYDEYVNNQKNFSNIPTYEKYLEFKEKGERPFSIVEQKVENGEGEVTYHSSDYASTFTDLVRQFTVNTLVTGPIGIKVEFDISKEQFEKTPYLPLDARLMWRGFREDEAIMSYGSGDGEGWCATFRLL